MAKLARSSAALNNVFAVEYFLLAGGRVHLVNEVTDYFWRVFFDIYVTMVTFQNNYKISKATFIIIL